jgi:hypothetical protein
MAGKPDGEHPGLLKFAQANFGLVTLAVAILAIGDNVRTFAQENFGVLALVLAVAEAGIIGTLYYLYRNYDRTVEGDPFPEFGLKFERVDFRFGGPDDFPGTERVYHQWFKTQLSVDDAEFCHIAARGPFLRVAEATLVDGSEETHRIVGYYTVWPIAQSTFDKLVSGKMKERELKSEMVLSFSAPNATVLYIPEICASKEWNGGSQLVRDLQRYVLHQMEQHKHLNRIGTWPYSKYGRRLVRCFKLRRPKKGGLLGRMHEITRERALTLSRPRTPFAEKWSITY